MTTGMNVDDDATINSLQLFLTLFNFSHHIFKKKKRRRRREKVHIGNTQFIPKRDIFFLSCNVHHMTINTYFPDVYDNEIPVILCQSTYVRPSQLTK
jgi:hypothetical protein